MEASASTSAAGCLRRLQSNMTARRMTSLALMPSSAARVLAGLTQAQLARQVGPTVDEAGVPRGCTFPLVCALDDDAQRLDQIDRFPVGDLIVDENRWRRTIV
jgi:hypothetical protein